jgi:hypothetical protein
MKTKKGHRPVAVWEKLILKSPSPTAGCPLSLARYSAASDIPEDVSLSAAAPDQQSRVVPRSHSVRWREKLLHSSCLSLR